MGELTRLAKQHFKGEGPGAPAFEFMVGGRRVPNSKIQSIKGVYTRESGSSSMTVEADFPFDRFEEARASLRVGYGDKLVEYFTGKVQDPGQDTLSRLATCEVRGPFASMQESFGRDVDFTGQSVAEFSLSVGRFAKQGARFLDVQGGYDTYVEEGAFVRETELSEALRTVYDKLDFVMLDRPGFKRLVMPTPAPGARGKSIARYDESDYPAGSNHGSGAHAGTGKTGVGGSRSPFRVSAKTKNKYAWVNVFRRDDKGNYPVDEWVRIPHRGRASPSDGKVFYVPEFPGNARQAAQTAARKAVMLAKGVSEWSLGGVYINPELLLYDTVTITRTNLEAYKKPALEIFSCLIDKQIGFEVSPSQQRFHMELSGDTAVLTNVVPLEVIERGPRLTFAQRGIVSRPATLADFGYDTAGFWLNSEIAYAGVDSGGWFVDEEISEGNMGIDAGGAFTNG